MRDNLTIKKSRQINKRQSYSMMRKKIATKPNTDNAK